LLEAELKGTITRTKPAVITTTKNNSNNSNNNFECEEAKESSFIG